jgi:hypothetical protein
MASTINASTSAGLVSTADTSGVLQLQAANTTVLNAELGKALALQGATSTTGCGIAFPSAISLSTDPNTLDEYEEGTFNPTIDSATPGVGRVTTVTTATYTRIGRSVNVVMFLTLATLGTGGSGQIVINGLPFTAASFTGLSVGYVVNTASNLVAVGAYVTNASTSLNITGNSAASLSLLGNISFATYAAASFGIMVSGTYFI